METLFLNLLALTGPVSALIVLLWLLTPLMQKSFAAKWRQYMWLFCAVRLLLPIKLFPSSLYTIELPAMPAAAHIDAAASGAGIKAITVLSAVWLAGFAVFTAAQIISYTAFRKSIKRRGAICANSEIVKIFTVSKAAMGVRGKISLRICKTLKSPMVTGFLHPTLLLPRENYSAEEAEIIIRHELIHFKKRHLWYKLLLLLTEAECWFNPFVYIMFRAAQKDMELACDDEVIRGTDGEFRRRYCETILNGIHRERGRANVLTTCLNVNKKILMERFGNILNMGVKRNGIPICLAVSVSLIAGSAVVSFAEGKVSNELSEAFDYKPVPVSEAVMNAVSTSAPTAVPTDTPVRNYENDTADDDSDAEYISDDAPEYDYVTDVSDDTPDDIANDAADHTPDYASDHTPDDDADNAADDYSDSIPEPEENIPDDTPESYSETENGSGYADISVDASRSFEGEEITNDNSRTITVETDGGDVGGDSFTAYIRAGNDGYEMIRSEDDTE